jgi:hypothetical protein
VLPIVLAGNSLRAALLFLIETADTPMPGYLHSLVGSVTFAIVAALLLASEKLQTRGSRRRHRHRHRHRLQLAVHAP